VGRDGASYRARVDPASHSAATPAGSAILHRRRALWLAALVLLAWLPFDLLRPQGALLAGSARLVWVVALLAAAPLQRPDRPRLALLATQAAAIASAVACLLLIASQGGANGPFFGFLVALPLTILGFVPQAPSTALLAGVVTTVGGVYLNVQGGQPVAVTVEWVAISLVLVGLAYLGIRANRRMLQTHFLAEQTRERVERELVESERRRERAERLALVGQLASGVAHEINNPLSYVKANLAWLRAEAASDEAREAVEEGLGGVRRIAQIVADLRAFARAAPDEVEEFPLVEALEEAQRIVAARLAGVRVVRELEAGPHRIRAVRRWLVQALVNLLANAADALEQAEPSRRWVRVELRRSGEELLLAVADGGPGIPDAVASRLFEPFFTTKGEKGTGLGLALTREQVERSGGRIEVGREPGGGARFSVRLPAL